MRKKTVIKTVSYVKMPDGSEVLFESLPLEEKRRIATQLKLQYLRAMFPGVDFYVTKEGTDNDVRNTAE